MSLRHGAIVLLALLMAACTGDAGTEDADAWVGTITTEGNVTTVINESGSVWGGTAQLVEEVSIGVAAGADEYMFGQVVGVYATNEHIYVVDQQAPRLRQYTLDGTFVRDFGREGQGPGEYVSPDLVMGDEAGRIFLQVDRSQRFNVYSESGEVLDSWPAPDFVCCMIPMVPAPGGLLWTPVFTGFSEEGTVQMAIQLHGPEGPVGSVRVPPEIEFEPADLEIEFSSGLVQRAPAPFAPRFSWNIAPSGAIVAGASDRYRFEIQGIEGPTLIVERYWEPVAVGADEAEWQRRLYVATLLHYGASPEWTWDGAEMPATKPAFSEFLPTAGGGIWVVRQGPSERLADCVEDPIEAGFDSASAAPCWRDTWILDAFDSEGRYLGEIEDFNRVWFAAATVSVRGNTVVAPVEDETGTIMVKRYRLVLPGEDL